MVKSWDIGIVTLSILIWGTTTTSYAVSNGQDAGNFYVSLGYGPTISKVNNFNVGVDRETKWIFQHNAENPAVLGHSENFYWSSAKRPDFKFENYGFSLKGSAGYMMSGLRMEIEVGHEKSNILESGVQKRVKSGGIPFVLGKEVTARVSSPGDSFAAATKKYKNREFVEMHNYVESIVQGRDRDIETVLVEVRRYLNVQNNARRIIGRLFRQDHVAERRVARSAMGRRFAALSPEKKMIFVRSIAMTVEGAEVIEIDAIKSTSVTANLCYDFPTLGFSTRVNPYTCGGIGGSIVGITDGHTNVQFSYKFKMGLTYRFNSYSVAYIDASYHKVVGEDYEKIPLLRLVDDISPSNGSKGIASAQFGLSYLNFEVGSRMIF